ncbi:uncharacterized protein LOC18442530 isoform X2 [Amborella trichopoda]|uniref:uncharacterized protein LOC18442530 isoform X2 n=1 Tax=Amborella trichopoda TaxID=13333 RepID=UPI0009BF8A76|nr:uncharacterized protein LOC18442530 isoform X2 [Amborella trichopoda]|eukprot:XP_020528139.1 uncharacterized protein LOC18442530 isoform X2 [Amborella trichopoda]
MVFLKTVAFVPAFSLFLFSIFFCSSNAYSSPPFYETSGGNPFPEKNGVVSWRRVAEEIAPAPAVPLGNESFVLAAERTRRQDPSNDFKHYTGGWNLSEHHYWVSVAFTAAPLFVIAGVWFVVFGVVLFLSCCCYCCCPRRAPSYSRVAYALSLIFLLFFTCAAIVGCAVLYTGQGKFHESTTETLDYVVGQANLTVDNLKNFSRSLSAAKTMGVNRIFLPTDDQAKIENLVTKLNASANTLQNRTEDNSQKIQNWLDTVRYFLIVVAAVMLFLAFIGFLLSILGIQVIVYILVVIGWILVAGTFILCGVFLLLNNVVSDTCVAMDEWVDHPHARTALDDILPCVDVSTANESLYRSKEVSYQLANVVNQVITNVSNGNFPPIAAPLYYNQSGPLVPVLCNRFNSDISYRNCQAGEVTFKNASQVWRGYVCEVSSSGLCTSVGRLTPDMYNQMVAATNVSYGLYRYGPFLTQLEDCTFVRETFNTISDRDCPGLRRYSKLIYIGLVMVSSAVMLSLIFWVIYSRERRHRVYNKRHRGASAHALTQDKGP